MARFDLNLSTRPFPAYRVINFGLLALSVILLLVSVWQVAGFVQFSRQAREIRPIAQEARVEAESLGGRVAELSSRLDRPEATAKLNEIGFLNSLIARKNLSWTRLFADMENLVPDSVHLVTLTPTVGKDGAVTLKITLQARSIADATEFVKRLETSPVFANIALAAEEKTDLGTDVGLELTTNYFPQRDGR